MAYILNVCSVLPILFLESAEILYLVSFNERNCMSFNKTDKEDPLEIRPRFKLLINNEIPQELLEYIKDKGKTDDTIRIVKSYSTHLDIHVPRHEESFWSPVLQLNFDKPDEAEGTLLRCLIGPQQSHWLMFVFIYGVLSVIGFFSGVYGITRYIQFNEFTPWLYSLPVSVVIITAIYIMVKMAQKAKHQQIVHLVRFLYQHLDGHEYHRITE